jgi:predicted nucleic acid-binding protein
VKNNYTLDSFALLCWLQGEKAASQIEGLLHRADQNLTQLFLNIINLGEIYYLIYRERGSEKAEHTLSMIESLPINLIISNKELTLKAAQLKALHPISYADAFCAATGIITKSIIVTGDPEFKHLKEKVKIKWLQKNTT